MGTLIPSAPGPLDVLLPVGTEVVLDANAKFLDRNLISGGSPWRILRLSGSSLALTERWRNGGKIRAGEERFARTLVLQGLVHPRFIRSPNVEDIDVVIPTHGELSNLGSLLDQLGDFHVTVVDDGSVSPEAIRACCTSHGAFYLRLATNGGPGRARNKGLAATKRAFVWFLDVDVEVGDPVTVATTLRSAFGDPLVAAIAPRITGSPGITVRDRFEEHFSPLDMGETSGLVIPSASIGYLPSACLMVRRSAQGDGFDETLRVGEDVDFVWRLHDAGWLVRYDASVGVTHRARTTWRSWWLQRQRYGESSAALARRHGTRLAPLRSDSWTLLAWASVLVGRPLIGARIVRSAQRHARLGVFQEADDPEQVSKDVVGRNMLRAGGPLARAAVRTFGPLLLLAMTSPRLRKRAALLFAAGTLWRWRRQRLDVSDLPLAVADDLAYGVGVMNGALQSRSIQPLKPNITTSSMSLRQVLGLPSTSENHRSQVDVALEYVVNEWREVIDRLAAK